MGGTLIMGISSYLIKRINSLRVNERNATYWKILFITELILGGGKNRKIVNNAIIKQISKKISFYRPFSYHPKGIIYSVEKWFKDPLPSQMEGSWIKQIIPETTVNLKQPNHIYNDIHPSFIDFGKSVTSPKGFLSFFKNVRVVNENGAIISYDGKVFADFTFEFSKSIGDYEVFRYYISKPQLRKECLATITSTGNTGYFHWIFDSLPRIKLLEGVIGEIDYLIVPYNLKKFHLETLNLLGFPENRLLKIKDGMHLQCEKLFVPSMPGSTGDMPKWACEFLRESFLPEGLAEPYRLIYISRGDALYREVINEKEVEDYLQTIGFKIFQMSELSFLEQVKIYAEARIVISPHGAGLSNTVFCRNAKILEIFAPSYVNVCYWVLANQVGNEYYYHLGEDEPGNSPPPWRNFRVDMKIFKETLDKMLKND